MRGDGKTKKFLLAYLKILIVIAVIGVCHYVGYLEGKDDGYEAGYCQGYQDSTNGLVNPYDM